jgi:RNA recognition motif-containing protein
MRDRRTPAARGNARSNGQRPDKHRATVDNTTLEDQCHPRKVFVGGLAHKTTTQHLRDHFGRFGAIVDAVVLRWPDGRSRGFGYVTYADATAAAIALEEEHAIAGRPVDVKRAVPGTNKLFVGGLPQNTTANELRDHFEKFGAVSDAVVMIDPTTGRSRGFGFVCFLPGNDGAEAVAASLEKYDNHRIRGKWIEVKNAAPPHKLASMSQEEQSALSKPGPSASASETESEEIAYAGALRKSPASSKSTSVESSPLLVPQTRVASSLGSPRKVALPGFVDSQCMKSDTPSKVTPWWPAQAWNPTPPLGGYGGPLDGFGGPTLGYPTPYPRTGMPPGFSFDASHDARFASPPSLSAAESLQLNLEIFLRQAMESKIEQQAAKGSPSISTACSATASQCADN